MAHPEQPDAATDESGAADSPAGGEPPEKDALAGAEEAAAREAQVEASRAESAASAKVCRERGRRAKGRPAQGKDQPEDSHSLEVGRFGDRDPSGTRRRRPAHEA